MSQSTSKRRFSTGRSAAFLVAAIGLTIAMRAEAEPPFTILHSFSMSSTDGAEPEAGLLLGGDGYLYGTTTFGGANSAAPGAITDGTIFKIKIDGTGFVLLHSFSGGPSDASDVMSGLIMDGKGFLYGTAAGGGAAAVGAVYRVAKDGTGFTLLHSFSTADGALPDAGLTRDSSGNLYGTTAYGGSGSCTSSGAPRGCGTVFAIRMDGTGFAVLHSFSFFDGASPQAALILDGNGFLYGTTRFGGAGGGGTIFRVRSDGTEFTLLRSLAGADGLEPHGDLTLDADDTLYGTTSSSSANKGTIFALNTDGGAFRILHSFTDAANDGAGPVGGLTLDERGNLFGGTVQGGESNHGTIFRMKTDGTGFALLYSFPGLSSDGYGPAANLVLDTSGYLYGTTFDGGPNSCALNGYLTCGTVFRIGGSWRAGIPAFPPPEPARPAIVTGR